MLEDILYAIGIIISGFFIYYFLKLFWYEHRINEEYKDMQQEIDLEKAHDGQAIQEKVKAIKDRYTPVIEELERKRRFILEKLPFIKK